VVVAGLLLGGVLFGVASSVVASAPALAQSATQIVIEGNRRVEADTIRSYFKVAPGEHLDAAKIDSALKALYGSGLFQDIRISQAGGRLVVTVVEAPVIDRIAFEGNNKLKDEQLQQEIQSKARGTLSKAAVQADVTRIIEVYHRNGRFDVQVVPKIVERPNNRVDLIFEIREGEKTGVRSIIFVGNHAYSDYRLKEVIKTSTSNWFSFLQTTDVYDTDRIEADRDLIRRFYLTHGYADVQVVSATGEYDPAPSRFSPTSAPSTRRRCSASCACTAATSITATRSRRRSKTSPLRSPSTDIRSRRCARAASATRRTVSSTLSMCSTKAYAPISSASISAAIPARATM
jgi:outer membrane protein insertion porin family